MSMRAALFLIVMAVASELQVSSGCRNPAQCPCGNTGKNFTICLEEYTTDDPCNQWAGCKSCRERTLGCEACPEGYEGVRCTKVQRLKRSRQKRQYQQYWQPGQNQFTRVALQGYPRAGRCPDIDSPKVGSIRCITSNEQRTCTGTCFPGHRFENMEYETTEIQLSCQNGVWTPFRSFPTCKSGGHCDLIVVGHGSFNCTIDMRGTRCDIRCSNRYVGQYFCYPGRPWEPPLPQCVRPKEGDVPMELRQPCRCEYGGSCDRNGNCVCPVGRTGTFCESIIPDRQSCRDPGFIASGHRRNMDGSASSSRRQFEDGESVVFGCNEDEDVLQGSTFLTCNDGRWSGGLPRCIKPVVSVRPEVTCSDPGQVANADRLNSDGSLSLGLQTYRVGQSVAYTCRPGFALQRRSLITCQARGTWSFPLPICTPMNPPTPARPTTTVSDEYCLNPGSPQNGRVVYYPNIHSRRGSEDTLDDPEYPPGSRLQYSCDDGYTLQGDPSLVCLGTGEWTADAPTCTYSELAYCENPGPISNGQRVHFPNLNSRTGSNQVDDPEYPQGTMFEYSCNTGYTLEGTASLTCEESGYWSADRPRCRRGTPGGEPRYCDNPGSILDGSITPIFPDTSSGSGSDADNVLEYPEGTRLQYSCEDDYALRGSSELTCQFSGEWSSDPPTCLAECGVSFMKTTRRVIHGSKTEAGQWPWVVAIGVQENGVAEIICGGAVLNSGTVVTAAHCLVAETFTLYFGKLHRSVNKDDAKVMVRQSTHWIRHPDFNSATYDSDIGLIMFSPRIRFTDRVQPICMPSFESTAKNLMTGQRGYVTGWGLTERSLPADELLLAQLPYLTNEECMEAYRRQELELNITQNMICAGFQDGQQAACSGDSGSPLVFYDYTTKSHVLEGLVSFGVRGQCGLPGRYTVFTKVSRFGPWILRNLS